MNAETLAQILIAKNPINTLDETKELYEMLKAPVPEISLEVNPLEAPDVVKRLDSALFTILESIKNETDENTKQELQKLYTDLLNAADKWGKNTKYWGLDPFIKSKSDENEHKYNFLNTHFFTANRKIKSDKAIKQLKDDFSDFTGKLNQIPHLTLSYIRKAYKAGADVSEISQLLTDQDIQAMKEYMKDPSRDEKFDKLHSDILDHIRLVRN